ncbi:hypothetical protein PC41400_14695 [Paenibacillus chitinolyticus]|uniref:Uncharacterized protein n=1 Tax=Paenibacillus chitinolyticus TaxID=79263 RepID=A0A410WWS3_9BACL|nr:hypothetical protein [Paenibacillus chitinolyticus]MCY9593980.1 hypothetical protein [Paenibacillus chitinolyticus]MCY9599635.1 hypothetical protein [Paenibacillus chitinolyticus]QAV18858.1 hypothetical protein PC41400_14695 [Paenibacillus chitinolyticus]
MGKLMPIRIIQHYDEKIIGHIFYDELQYCIECSLHFSCNIVDSNGNGIKCPKCSSGDHLLDVGTVEIKLVETSNPSNIASEWAAAYEDEELEPEYHYFGVKPQIINNTNCYPWDGSEL